MASWRLSKLLIRILQLLQLIWILIMIMQMEFRDSRDRQLLKDWQLHSETSQHQIKLEISLLNSQRSMIFRSEPLSLTSQTKQQRRDKPEQQQLLMQETRPINMPDSATELWEKSRQWPTKIDKHSFPSVLTLSFIKSRLRLYQSPTAR